MKSFSTEKYIYYTLRAASAMCLLGHGSFGVITKAAWCNYFAVFGIGHDTAYQLMPILGAADILMGLVFLFYPIRGIALWLVCWGLITAALRPLSGEPLAEMIERAGNFGAPLALLIFCGPGKDFISWFRKINPPDNLNGLKVARLCLRVVAFLLLAGHGWLNVTGNAGLLEQYRYLGFNNVQQVALMAGIIEIAMALMVLIKPLRGPLLIILGWKIVTELFYPHYEIFEWLERGGSYGTLLALYFALEPQVSSKRTLQWTLGFTVACLGVICVLYFGDGYGYKNSTGQDNSFVAQQPIDQYSLNKVRALDKQTYHATFVFVNPGFARVVKRNKIILLKPISDSLRINFDEYLHTGHNGPLYIILPDKYAGPKEKFIFKSFPGYKGWYGSMLSNTYVMYAAS